jgi:hypothetical protein
MKRLFALLVAVVVGAGCADGTIVLVKDDDDTPDTIDVKGNIFEINKQTAGADLVIFVFTDLIDDGTFDTFAKQRSVAIASDASPMEFTIDQVEPGDLTVAFLLDSADEPDGTIDPGDEFAILDDPDEVLEDVRNAENIRITDIRINITEGTATAESIRSVLDDTEEPEE